MNEPKVYIIILNWNGYADTLECLSSVLNLAYQNYTVVIVDNGSEDASVERLKAVPGRVTVLATGKNLGYAGGNNYGLRYALDQGDLDYAWILNNDTVVDPAALSALVERAQADPRIGLCGSMVMHYSDRKRISALGGGYYDRWFGQSVHPGSGQLYDDGAINSYLKLEKKINYIEGCATLVSAAYLREIGLMNEEYFLFFEEIDWAVRGRKKFRLGIAPKSLVYHKGGASIGQLETNQKIKSPARFGVLFDRYNTRNRLLFTLKYFPYALPIVYLSVLGYLIDRLRCGAWSNAWVIIQAFGRHLLKLFRVQA
ncbi:hypothetical protein A2311_00525 [candidate division WOR-1 bacterium RIFOXYB2_FULL_48_7]|uniref:Glycosyltransferase 2-like domain-containing protein n=1 Tax=candidate division WOR-1 bacterium RIFOXYB2_FULL_48_7 TaxID=1802583 RepID=A0A1F4TTN3_UNCSA|nr:MAG: hypothetical protein A2311_00525 [candidate division WOR-1 bacterium RIFOXYB2_FULL_48_7]